MRSILVFSLLVFLGGKGEAQYPGLSLPPSGDNQRASVTQFIGPVKVTIDYNSPKVHGPDGADRRGKIWGQLVPYGLTNLGFGHNKPAPWRAGANENTVFSVSHAVKLQGKPLPAGHYGLHVIAEKDEWTVVFSKNYTSWGSFFYEPSEDALRITVKPVKHDYREWLTYEFTERRPTKAVVELQWEDVAAGWTIEVDQVDEIYISKLREELRTVPGFNWQAWVAAAQYTVQSNAHLDQGLEWAEAAMTRPFIGVTNFATLSTKSQVLAKLGRVEEADKLMQTAVKHPSTTPVQIHQYGRMLLQAGKKKEAFDVFDYNRQRNGDAWPVHVGLARGYSALGENEKALEHAKKALPQAPDEINRTSLENMIKTLSSGK